MEKRALVAILLSVAIMVIWQIFVVPPPVQPPPEEAGVGGPAGPAGEAPEPAERSAAAETPPAAPGELVEAAAQEEFRLITADQDVRFSNLGGRATWWRLPRYTRDGGVAVDVIPEQARKAGILPLQLEVAGDAETSRALAEALFAHEMSDIPAGDPSGLGPGKRVSFVYADGKGLSARKTLELPERGYVGKVTFDVRRGGRPLPARLIIASGLAEQADDDDTTRYGHVEGGVVVYDGVQVLRVAPDQAQAAQFGGAGGPRVVWGGLESTYFAALVLAPDPTSATLHGADVALHFEPRRPAAGGDGKAEAAPLVSSALVADGGGGYTIFVGPKDFNLLRSLGRDLERAIDFSRFSLIYLCTKYLFVALTWINSYVGNYGWSIILLTIMVRVAFFPLMYKSSIAMRQTSKKMAKVQPKVKAIQERYRKVKRSMETQGKMNEEIMALYKREGINPMGNLGGCLPILLQMPVFIAFYNLLAVTIELRHAPFIGWIQDLSRRDPYYITPLLMGASWLLQQAMTSSSIPDPMQRRMMMLMPVMFTFFMFNMPSGLVLYWLTSNLAGMAQQYITNKKADQIDALAHGKPEAVSRPRRAEDGQTA